MRLPRCTIADVMALTFLASLDCFALRDHANFGIVVLREVSLPSLNVLVVASYVLARLRVGALSRFLWGFIFVGWLSFLWHIYQNAELIAASLAPLPPDVYWFRSGDAPEWVFAAFSLLQLMPAALAGLPCVIVGAWRDRRNRRASIVQTSEA